MNNTDSVITRTPWIPINAHATRSVWNGLPVMISRVFTCGDRPTNSWNAYVAGSQVGRWGMPMKTAVQSIAKSVRNTRAIIVSEAR